MPRPIPGFWLTRGCASKDVPKKELRLVWGCDDSEDRPDALKDLTELQD